VRKIVRALRPWRIAAAMFAYAVIEFGAGGLEGLSPHPEPVEG
jgi:hypothetical protein